MELMNILLVLDSLRELNACYVFYKNAEICASGGIVDPSSDINLTTNNTSLHYHIELRL